MGRACAPARLGHDVPTAGTLNEISYCRRCKRPFDTTETCTSPVFSIGARVLIDERDEAIIEAVFPEGSTSYTFPHYKVRFINGESNVAVAMVRVGVEVQQ